MGSFGSKNNLYKSKEEQIQLAANQNLIGTKRFKRDGTVLRSKDQIVKSYDESSLPEPIRSLYELDYCWRLNYTIFRHSVVVGVPLTMCYHIWKNNDTCWRYTLRTIPYKRIAFEFTTILLLFNAFNVTWSLLLEDYCNRKSMIYDQNRGANVLRLLIQQTNEEHKKTLDGKGHKTLTEEEILRER